jgi:hypothetical protein
MYHGSLCEILRAAYPTEEWQPWEFDQLPQGYWNNLNNRKYFIDWISRELKVYKPDDWYIIGKNSIISKGGGGLLAYYGNSLYKTLLSIYPDVEVI